MKNILTFGDKRLSRRDFGALTLVLATQSKRLFAAPNLDATIRESMTRRG